jgi:hypothetical protein
MESICIPSSVAVLREACFYSCASLRTVTFGPDSQLGLIEQCVFGGCRSLASVLVPHAAAVIGPSPVSRL